MSDAKQALLAAQKAKAVSDTKKAALAAQKAAAASQAGVTHQVAGTGPFGLPPSVSILGLNVPTLALVAVGGALLLALAALAVHAFRK